MLDDDDDDDDGWDSLFLSGNQITYFFLQPIQLEILRLLNLHYLQTIWIADHSGVSS